MLCRFLIAGLVAIEPTKYDEFGWSYIIEIVDHIKAKYPDTPVILFPKGVSPFIERGLVYGNFDVFGVDWSTPMALAKEKLGDRYVLQGLTYWEGLLVRAYTSLKGRIGTEPGKCCKSHFG